MDAVLTDGSNENLEAIIQRLLSYCQQHTDTYATAWLEGLVQASYAVLDGADLNIDGSEVSPTAVVGLQLLELKIEEMSYYLPIRREP